MCLIPSDIPWAKLSVCVRLFSLSQPSRSPKYIWEQQGRKRLCWSVGSLRSCCVTAPQGVSCGQPTHTRGTPALCPVPQPHFSRLYSPICSTISGGKTREAKALRKISENSLSRPPMPIFSKFQSGLMIDCRFSLVFDLPAKPRNGFKHSPAEVQHTQVQTQNSSAGQSPPHKLGAQFQTLARWTHCDKDTRTGHQKPSLVKDSQPSNCPVQGFLQPGVVPIEESTEDFSGTDSPRCPWTHIT